RRAVPFTFITFVAGSLALSGVVPTAGWLSKDDILGYCLHRGGLFLVLGILGYIGALLTGIYTFRMVFRAFFGDPCPEATELIAGHQHHAAQPFNPATGEIEDTDVGFPGPDHAIAERNWTMKVPMTILAILAIIGGYIEIPGVDSGIARFLAPSFATSRLAGLAPSTGSAWIGLIIGTLVGLSGIFVAYVFYVRQTEAPARLQARFAGLHTFLMNKWYFD
ncbi:MAG: NADH-quinone oxidoreductase subunit L, partial [Solirubrobacteraceae bacterium]